MSCPGDKAGGGFVQILQIPERVSAVKRSSWFFIRQPNALRAHGVRLHAMAGATLQLPLLGSGFRRGSVYPRPAPERAVSGRCLLPRELHAALAEDRLDIDGHKPVDVNAEGVAAREAQPFAGGVANAKEDRERAPGLTGGAATVSSRAGCAGSGPGDSYRNRVMPGIATAGVGSRLHS
jgi:hypothetical protein